MYYDIFFLSYNEPNAPQNFELLRHYWPTAKHVSGIKGIDNAHKVCADMSRTPYFFVVDAESEMIDYKVFTYQRPNRFGPPATYIWHAKNPVNDMEYGWGGIKLFFAEAVQAYDQIDWLDFSSSLDCYFIPIPYAPSWTRFNVSAASAWKAAFRESSKLAWNVRNDSSKGEIQTRLNTWCTKGSDRLYGDMTIKGANAGKDFAHSVSTVTELRKINDFDWLDDRYTAAVV